MDEVYTMLSVFGPMNTAQIMLCVNRSHASIYNSQRGLLKRGEAKFIKGKRTPGKSGGYVIMWEAIRC